MFIEFIDQLRCTTPHEESWLVATFYQRAERFIIEATLGCPICLRQYPIREGIVYFGDPAVASHQPATTPSTIADIATPSTAIEGTVQSATADRDDTEAPVRVAAFLNASEQSTLVLAGEWAPHAHAVAELLPLRIFALNPTVPMEDSASVAIVQSIEGIPLAAGTVHGVALDLSTATPRNVTTALAVLMPSGRLVAPAQLPVPPEVTLLASDESYWVGEKRPALVALRKSLHKHTESRV